MTPKSKGVVESEIAFLNANPETHHITYKCTDDGKDGRICVKIGEETREYRPIDFCEFMIFTWSDKAKKSKFKNGKSNLNKQAKIYVELRWLIILATERFLRKMKEHPECKVYSFDGIFRQIDGAIEESKLNLEIKLLNSQISANKSTIDTNRISKTTNVYIAIFTFVAAEYYTYEFLRDYISDLNTHKAVIINWSIVVLLTSGILGFLLPILPKWQKDKKDKP